ncbi:MAG: VWA domain-containing protein [Planctomycetes bacterium]|nr:VWA domain-containing protein [Planctomycetota bacterium]
MNVEFAHPWLMVAGAALLLAAPLARRRLRRWPPVLFVAAAAFLLAAAAQPRVQVRGSTVTHVAVLDVSGSMEPRLPAAREALKQALAQLEMPAGHEVRVLQLSDAVRDEGAPVGGATDYARLADALRDADGELVLVTDGRGSLEALLGAVPARRVVMLPAPVPDAPDAAVANVQGPSVLARGATGMLGIELFCDRDAELRWRVFEDDREAGSGTKALRAGVPAGVTHQFSAPESGLLRLRVQVETPGDRDPRNDSAAFACLASGRRVIEYACDPSVPPESDALLAVLRADARNDVRARHTLPATRAELEGIGLLVINNLSREAAGLERSQLQPIADWVNAGGNLLMVGASGAFAPGGYRGSPLEAVMPVRFVPADEPPRHLLLLLDASASMGETTAGGRAKLELLKEAARRATDALPATDQVAVVGFSERLLAEPAFTSAGNKLALANAIEGLRPLTRTHICRALETALSALQAAQPDPKRQPRLLLVTDGENTDGSGSQQFAAVAERAAASGVRVDVVITSPAQPDWLGWMKAGAPEHVFAWGVGDKGFEDLFAALERANDGFDRRLLHRESMEVAGVTVRLPLLVRTAPRKETGIEAIMDAQTPVWRDPWYPLLYWRQLGGRTAVMCTESAGTQELADFWMHPFLRQRLDMVLNFLLAHAGRANLALNPLPDNRHELVWVGAGPAPQGDLTLQPGGSAVREGPGRWLIEALPEADELRVLEGERLLQRLPLPRRVPAELARTGNDEVFFSMAELAGVRVFSSLAAWQPNRFEEQAPEPLHLEWAAATAAALLLLGGFALRRRS